MAGVALTVALLAGIYPEGHFDHVTKCTQDNFEGFVKEQAPAWNTVTKAFENNTAVAFGDINLSQESIRASADGASYSPGAGGWPTIRYFNQATGYAGAPYAKKTSKAMCDELGDAANMQAYVEEAGSTSLCDLESGEGCEEREVEFYSKWKGAGAEAVGAEKARLEKMAGGKMKPELQQWLSKRLNVLSKIGGAPAKEEL